MPCLGLDIGETAPSQAATVPSSWLEHTARIMHTGRECVLTTMTRPMKNTRCHERQLLEGPAVGRRASEGLLEA